MVRGYAAWALGKIGEQQHILEHALAKETDIDTKKEIFSALNQQ
jgi:hypothetical protein